MKELNITSREKTTLDVMLYSGWINCQLRISDQNGWTLVNVTSPALYDIQLKLGFAPDRAAYRSLHTSISKVYSLLVKRAAELFTSAVVQAYKFTETTSTIIKNSRGETISKILKRG